MQELNYASKLFFKNYRPSDIPPVDRRLDSPYMQMVADEREKCIRGVNVGGLHIWGSLYYFLNHHFIDYDDINEFGEEYVKIDRPLLRDNDWIIHKGYNEAKQNKEGFMLAGLRQFGKSTTQVCLASHELFFRQNAEVLALYASKADKQTFTKKIEIAIKNNTDFIVVPSIDQDFTKEQIRFGIKKTDNEDFIFSKLFVYLTDEGRKTEVAAGKALVHGTKVHYAKGTGLIENVKEGDRIYGADGQLTTVMGVYPQKKQECFRLTFSDGRTVECTGDHLWTLYTVDKHKQKTLSTNELRKTYLKKNGQRKFYLPNIQPLEYPEAKQYIDPYYLGLWLGDGDTNSFNRITTADSEIVEYLKDYAIQLGGRLDHRDTCRYAIRNLEKNKHNPISILFKAEGLDCVKRIPDNYLYCSIEQRLELLRGLMDTDGTIDKKGRIEIALSDEDLIKDVENLIRSLGIPCKHSIKNTTHKDSHRLYLGSNNLDIFKLTRKKARVQKKKKKNVTLSNIEPIGERHSTCLRVSNKDHLFLVDNYVPTHNTPSFVIYDEIAKAPCIEVHEALLPALRGRFGLRCSPFYCFTGGSVEKGQDAKKMFFNPKGFEFRDFGNGHGLFMPGEYKSDMKENKSFGDFIKEKENIDISHVPEIADMDIAVTNFDRAKAALDEQEAEAQKISLTSYNKRKMYYPRSVQDMFLAGKDNPFAHLNSEFEKLLHFLERNPLGTKVEFIDGNAVPSDKPRITEYPSSNLLEHQLDAPSIILVDKPNIQPGRKLYHFGADVYNTIKTSESPSLGSWYAIQGFNGDYNDPWNDRVVAYNNSRKNIKHFQTQLLGGLKFFGADRGCATLLHEAADDNLTQWYDERNIAFMLEDTYNLSREINPNATAYNVKGLRATLRNQEYYLQKIMEYLEEELPDGRLGLWRIPDPYLIQQFMQFDGDLGPCDAIVAFGHAVTHLYKEKKYITTPPTPKPVDEQSRQARQIRSVFGSNYNSGGKKYKTII